uniref:PALM2 and AKAP2 fusion n=1 Tax=Tetraodon nigroviridis TaxID=99883 RepID=H3D6Q9_TETNG
CEEAQLHRERLQALAEKRKRQTEIEDKRSQLDELVLQLQHLKSKAMRERWLLQGMSAEEVEVRQKQLEQDEEQGKRLEDLIHRLESEIGALENEESQISAKEQVLRERLKETERSIEDLQKSLMSQDGGMSNHITQSLPPSHSLYACTSAPLPDGTPRAPEHLVLASPPRAGPPASGELAVPPRPALGHSQVGLAADVDDLSPPSCAPPSIPSSPPAQVTLQREARLGIMPPVAAVTTQPSADPTCPPQASEEHPVTMVFLGYQDVEDTSESRRLLGFDGTVKAEREEGTVCWKSWRVNAPRPGSVPVISAATRIRGGAASEDETGRNGRQVQPQDVEDKKSSLPPAPLKGLARENSATPTDRRRAAGEFRFTPPPSELQHRVCFTRDVTKSLSSPKKIGAKFELRAFQEERRPAKLFTPGDEQQVRVTRRRPTEEVQELERERQELIKEQAVKRNPEIAHRWWNPPQEVPLEEQLDAEQLESLKKYQERKQQKQTPVYSYGQVRQAGGQPQVSGQPTVVTFDPELIRKEDIVEEQIDFSSARRQFLQGGATKRDVPPHIYSAKPFLKSRVGGDADETGEGHVTWSDKGLAGEFTCARAVMTILTEEEDGKGHFHPSFHLEESDSGLDEPSVRSQDTTVFSLDSVSDSGASAAADPGPPTPQPAAPVNGQSNGSPTEDELEYQAGILVQNAIQNALAARLGSAPPSLSPQGRRPEVRVVSPDETSESQRSAPEETRPQAPSAPPPQPVSPPQRSKNGGPRIKIQSSYARALASSAPAPAPAPAAVAPVPRPAPVYRPPSPPSPEKPEFSYFSKYSEAAELRSTASASRAPEVEPASGPFRLRSKKQRTLSMIEEEIRAAQQREEELKKQRKEQPAVTARPSSQSHNSLPARLTLTAKTAPGKIEKVRLAPPVSPSPSEGALSDAGSEDSTGSRPKNFMQTLMEDYEVHKVKRRDKMEDSSYARLLLANEVTTEVPVRSRANRPGSHRTIRASQSLCANQSNNDTR